MTKLTKIVFLLLISLSSLSLRASADGPSYSVTVGGGSFSPSSICSTLTAKASVAGSLSFQSNSQEISESGDSWSWTALVTAYEATSQSGFGAVPSGVIPPAISATSGSAITNVTASADQTTSPGYYLVTVSGTDNFNINDTSTNPTTVTPASGSNSTTLVIAVVTIGDIQYNDPINGWTSIPSDFVAMDGTTSPVRAMPIPSDASFPSGQPMWGGIASGSGATATATFSTDSTNVGDETITATLGGAASQSAQAGRFASANAASSPPAGVSRNATTFKLTPILLPDITFPGRSTTTFGVGEYVSADFSVNPVGTPMPSTAWSISHGPAPGGAGYIAGQMLDNGATGNEGHIWVGASPGAFTFLKLSVTSGPSTGKSVSSPQITVIAPKSGDENKDTSYGDEHINETINGTLHRDASAGFYGFISLLPSNVSFRQTQFAEEDVYGTGNNDLSYFNTRLHFPGSKGDYNEGNTWTSIIIDPTWGNSPPRPGGGKGEDGVGFVSGPDSVDANGVGTFTASTGEYDVPWNYRVINLDGTFTGPTVFYTMKQKATEGADGSATITKGQGLSKTQINDPNNDFLGFFQSQQ